MEGRERGRTVLSDAADAMNCPPGENWTALIMLSCPSREKMRSPLNESQILIDPSLDTDMVCLPSSVNATTLTGP